MMLGMMRAILKLEAIGDDIHAYKKLIRRGDIEPDNIRRIPAVKQMRSKAWVARITGLDREFRFQREFLRGQRDYSGANAIGSRGVYIYYALTDGVYEVNAPLSWTRTDRYFMRVEGTQMTRMTLEEVMIWAESSSEA